MYNEQLKHELSKRWNTLQSALQRENGDALLITSNVNLFYVSGRVFSGAVYIALDRDPIFFVRRPTGLKGDDIVYIRKPEEIPAHLQERGFSLPKYLFLESDSLSYNEYVRYEKIFSPERIGNGSRLLREARSIKTIYEIGRIMRSGVLHAQLYERIPSLFRPGMTDLDLSIEIERECRRLGSLGLFRIFGQSLEIFMGSLLAGDNADAPSPYDFALGGAGQDLSLPIGSNGTPLKGNISIMVDMGGNFTGYTTDMSRVFSVGKLPDLALKAHDTSLKIQQEIIRTAHPGVPAAELYNLAARMAEEAGLSAYFMGHRQQAGFVGHGIGIEINEQPVLAPRSKEVLKAGMVFALEPKFVIPEVGAVGVENSFLVTDNGLEQLTLCEEAIIPLD